MKFIKDIHDLVNFLAGKNVATSQPPERIDMVVYEVVVDVFNTYYDHYVKTQKISDYLLPFKRTKTITVTNSIGDLPGDYQHLRALRPTTSKRVDVVEDKFWHHRKNSKVSPPSAEVAIARIEIPEGDPSRRVVEVYPSQNVVLEYFKTPTKPMYAYTLSGTRYVYDDASSTDVDFNVLVFPDLKNRILSALGINTRDRDLTLHAERGKATEQMK